MNGNPIFLTCFIPRTNETQMVVDVDDLQQDNHVNVVEPWIWLAELWQGLVCSWLRWPGGCSWRRMMALLGRLLGVLALRRCSLGGARWSQRVDLASYHLSLLQRSTVTGHAVTHRTCRWQFGAYPIQIWWSGWHNFKCFLLFVRVAVLRQADPPLKGSYCL
jgi:hypothetical protein